MPYKLARWKPCDGGCAVRSPRFPNLANLGREPGRDPKYMAGDRFQRAYPGGTSPDGLEWVGGNEAHKQLWDLYESLNRNPQRITRRNFTALPAIISIMALEGVPGCTGPAWENKALQWYLDTDFGWPCRTPHVQAILTRLAELGLWDATFSDITMSYDTIYPDEWVQDPVDGHVNVGMPTMWRGGAGFGGQTFHVEAAMTPAEKAAQEPACCHMWQPCDDQGNPV